MTGKVRPFVKWVGGKGQLISQLEVMLPADFDSRDAWTYVEPFVGGGAMLFYMLQHHRNIRHAVINDINPDLITCYRTVRDHVDELITLLRDVQTRYYALADMDAKRDMYMKARCRYNEKNLDPVENSSLFFFLNRTCFNGLYRVNRKGLFNVPCGRYLQPMICDEDNLRGASELLRDVEILEGDFEQTLEYAGEDTFFYFDPPYRPLSGTSCFNDYTKEKFNDAAQIRLREFCDRVADVGAMFMLSNSDCKSENGGDAFFDELYSGYSVCRVMAARNVNANGTKRGKISELLVRSYDVASCSHPSISEEHKSQRVAEGRYAYV